MEAFLEQYNIPLSELADLAQLPGAARYPIDFDELLRSRNDHVQQMRGAARLLMLQRACRVHRGDCSAAVDSVISLHRMLSSLRDEPSTVAQLVRAALAGIACAEIVETVRDPAMPVEELKRLQDSWVENDWQRACFSSSLSERTISYELLGKPVSILYEKPPPTFNVPPAFVLLASRPGDAAEVLRIQSYYVDAARGALPTLIAGFRAVDQHAGAWARERNGPEREGHPQSVTPNNVAFVYLFGHVAQPYLRAATSERSAIAVLAIERFRRERGQLPDALDDLVPAYLQAVPADPCNGYPLRLVRRNGGYAVYGVGMDLVDNVGDVESHDQHRASDEGLFVPAIVGLERDGQPPPAVER